MQRKFLIVAAVAVCLDGAAIAAVAFDRAETKAAGKLSVSSPEFKAGEQIPLANSGYGDNKQPSIAWRGTARAASYAVLVEDPDSGGGAPFVHWVVYDIPGTALALTQASMAGTVGTNGKGATAWWGPRPPAGTGLHHYHVQVFALDTKLGLKPGASRDQVVAAMSGHVVAKGDLVGTYPAPEK